MKSVNIDDSNIEFDFAMCHGSYFYRGSRPIHHG